MKHLFIGGPADGQHVETDEAHYHVVAVLPPPAVAAASYGLKPSFDDLGYHPHFYYAHRLPANQKVYAPEDWSIEKVIETLIRRYPQPL